MAKKAAAAKPEKKKQFYGIAEWYGELFRVMDSARMKVLEGTKNTSVPCPFFAQVPALGPKSGKLHCNKKGGVCSLRNFHPALAAGDEITYGPITATCPNRFLENGTIVRHIGKVLLGTETPLFAKEIPFLKRPKTGIAGEAEAAAEAEEEEAEEAAEESGEEAAAAESGREDVGRIDLVFVHPDDPEKWCAVEMQAVYFSGGAMSADMAVIRTFTGNSIPMPGKARHPDFRSSGPKRLMPQLMIKVPTLRRWGKKMVVVIDRPFLDSMSKMESVGHISNCDIVWVVVRFDEDQAHGEARLMIDQTIFTTLDDAVIALTSGTPTTLPDFEGKLSGKLGPALPIPSVAVAAVPGN
ncbi:hypothetical protein EN850_02980 [Mesorhizobium sp. M8A.F.Ca.ET.207.01.1.1]|uniref:NotI family restriction endonuclease n=1 Tax=Mesorhizobium sp. M8A.F.Ca.ET.207.01.1.1 TaxID=2563968 RepID=UPI00109D21A5|nr:NotI family restriction endonuclease [Mesorhizobium sp. M8A.F.Ca.ET.207.01.1.1]TGQ83722.1 hypothetical protein EN850_02980 [Mesorhizobium sp. M8A.F.Ca.ET.207.01.1.1]